MREDIIFAGFGGQGIMLMGKLVSYAAMKEENFVTWMPSYGAEVRGGTAHSMVIISDTLIASPVVREPSICVAMNKPSLDKFEDRIKKNGLLIINRSLAGKGATRDDIDVLEIPATDLASEIGNVRVANMIILGALVRRKGILSRESLAGSLTDVISESHKDMIKMNMEAIDKGYEYSPR